MRSRGSPRASPAASRRPMWGSRRASRRRCSSACCRRSGSSRPGRPGWPPTRRPGRASTSRRASSRCTITARSRRSSARSSPAAPRSTATSRHASDPAARRSTVVLAVNAAVGAGALAWVLERLGGPALAVLAARPSATGLAAFAAVLAAGFVLFALRWRILLGGVGVPAGLGRLAVFRAAGQSLSSLVPSGKLGGEPLRAWLLVADGLEVAPVVASVAVDRILEVAASTAFACLFAAVLVRAGIPGLGGAAYRLSRGRGIVTAMLRAAALDRLPPVRDRLDTLAAVEAAAGRLLAAPVRLGGALAVGVGANLLLLVEYHVLLAALGLPAGPLAVVAAAFASGAAHTLPVPAAIGVLDGGALWLFTSLGYPGRIGLAVGLAARLREVLLVLPGLVYLLGRTLGRWRRARC